MNAEVPEYIDRLARFACETRYEDIPPAVIDRVKVMFADTLAVVGAGMQEPELRALAAAQIAAPGSAWVIGAERRAPAHDAALLNAIAGVWNELDEGNFHTNGHPGIHTIPAAFAYAQQHGSSGRELAAAIAVGYEICGRIGGAYKMKVMVQPHGTYGVIGAAVAAGRLAGLDVERMRQTINIAASTPMGGNRQTMKDGATVRNYYAGHGNVAGLMAVRLAQAGFTGPHDAPSVTFGQVLADDFRPERVVAGLGRRWTLEQGYIKLYPSARYVHSAIDALLDALRGAPGARVDPQAVRRVEVRGYRMVAFLGEKRPRNLFATRFSIPFSIATILRHGRADLDVFGPQALADATVMRLAECVECSDVPEFTRQFPDKQRVELDLVLADGRTLRGRCEITRGETGNPHDPADIERKYYQLAVPLWGEAGARQLRAQCLALETVPDVGRAFGP